eukprot:ANDGO_05195.mRNA.1 NPL4-like protein
MIIRFRSPQGLLRLDVTTSPDTTSIADIACLLSKEFHIDVCLIKRSVEDTQPLPLSATLSQLSIKHGDMLVLEFPPAQVKQSDDSFKVSGDTPLNQIRRHWTMKEFIDFKEQFAIKVEPQKESSVSKISFASQAANEFQAFIARNEYKQRMGWLFGRVLGREVFVDVIYEPPQQNSLSWVVLSDDPHFNDVVQIASLLGMDLVGTVFSHRVRSPPLNNGECLFAASNQLQRKHFTTVCSVLHENASVSFEAYQVSDVLCSMVDQKIVEPSEDVGVLKTKKPVVVDKREVSQFDVHRVILPVPISQHADSFRCAFPVENRGVVNMNTFAAFWHGEMADGKKITSVIRDFHLLLFLILNIFPIDSDGKALLGCLRDQEALADDDWMSWKMLLDGYAGSV